VAWSKREVTECSKNFLITLVEDSLENFGVDPGLEWWASWLS